MHALTAWFTRNPVAANLLMGFVLVAGIFSLTEIRIEGFPSIPPRTVSIVTSYPGASPEQVDLSISQRITKALEGMPGMRRHSSVSNEAVSTVTVEKVSGYDLDRFQNEIKMRVDSISEFPQTAERPVITRDEMTVEALLFQVYGDADEWTLQQTARLVREELLADPEIAKVEAFGYRPYEIRIELDEARLEALGLSFADVSTVIARNSLDYSTGELKQESGTITLRADGKASDFESFARMTVRTGADGSRVLLSDVAKVVDEFSDADLVTRFNGKRAVGFSVFTSGKGHLLRVSEAAHRIMERLRPQMPTGVELDIWAEISPYMKDRLNLLGSNAWQGLLIVFALLALFLDLRLAFWVAMGIPISIAAVFLVIGDHFLGHSLNDITTFGLILVLGILVDDAIVVGESVFESRRKIRDRFEGTIDGVNRVSTATVFGAFTTIAAFYPLLLIDNDLGKTFASFSVVVIVAILASLVESKCILPAHLAALDLEKRASPGRLQSAWNAVQQFAWRCLDFLNHRVYRPLLRVALAHRYSALVGFAVITVVGIGSIFNGRIKTAFFPDVPGQTITVTLGLHSGSPKSLLLENVQTIERQARELNEQLQQEFGTDDAPIARIMTAVVGDYAAEIWAELRPEKERVVDTMETLQRWRDRVGELEGVETLQFSGTFETGGGFAVEITGRDPASLAAAVELVSNQLKGMEGVHDVIDDLKSGAPVIRLDLKPEAEHLGLSKRALAEAVGDGFRGLETQRVLRDGEDVPVYLRYGPGHTRDLGDLLRSKVRTESGALVPLGSIAEVTPGYEPAAVYRKNAKRTVTIRAKLDKTSLDAMAVFQRLKASAEPLLREQFPGVELAEAGEMVEQGEMETGLLKAVVLVFLLIYVLIAVPLKSYWQPFVIMSVIPFGFVGAAIGHGLTGHSLSLLSFFGMLAAMGVVVNDSLVLLTRFNELRSEGTPLSEALLAAGTSRFRAIFLTTTTTVCGLLPLLTERSEQAQYLIPAVISLAFGVLFTTPVTLYLIPLLLRVAEDFTRFFGAPESEEA